MCIMYDELFLHNYHHTERLFTHTHRFLILYGKVTYFLAHYFILCAIFEYVKKRFAILEI